MKPYIFLIALAVIGCEDRKKLQFETDSLVIDDGLRGLFGVSSICGSCQSPKGMSHYIVTTLEFEDGKLVRRGASTGGSVESLPKGILTAQFLWDANNGNERTALVTPGASSRGDSGFWKRLVASNNFGDGSGPEYEGYKIMGMGQSNETRAGIGNMGFGPGLERALKERMYVGVLAVRFFSSQDQMDNFSGSDLLSDKNETEADSSEGDKR